MPKWQSTNVQNLVRNELSKRYYARFEIRGKDKWVALKTDKKTVAVLRLNDARAKYDKMRMAIKNVSDGAATMGEVVEIWKAMKLQDPKLNERSRLRKIELAKVIHRTWPELDKLKPEQVTREMVEKWRNRLRVDGTGFVNTLSKGGRTKSDGRSASNINKLLDCLRQMLDIAVERGQLAGNPMARKGLKLPYHPRKSDLPEAAVLHQIYNTIQAYNGCNSPRSADYCRLLNYTGMRVSEAANLCWWHVDFETGMLKVPGTKTVASKREVPMMKQCRELLLALYEKAKARAKTMVDGEPFVDPASRVSEVREATVSLRNACRRLKVEPPLTHHDLRDAFTTSCIEAGVDIPTVAAWLGHKDGGALLMKTYAHHRRKHSAEQAAKVSFGGGK